ncbi:hypothetical protein SAMN06264346_10434 [Chryseobacterium profundimaris]|uniref:Uncharacterized protein n=1 Tax=Chryseobacterium profundimaris TaxID=1387275 RepID=A0ABY1NRV6_9FLAO|nr:hypothetical protein SAMN06264346_10434 [Chryseobacterium profundimaris]
MKSRIKRLITMLKKYSDNYSKALVTIFESHLKDLNYEKMLQCYTSITPRDNKKFHNRWTVNIRLAILEIVYPI